MKAIAGCGLNPWELPRSPLRQDKIDHETSAGCLHEHVTGLFRLRLVSKSPGRQDRPGAGSGWRGCVCRWTLQEGDREF
ncbi:hypothetical protein DESC_770149 [Desulfosarcina cetonica]|nr:hypothetical protein DESC_770149 [Desulfosarcina cetonica]